MLGSVSHRIQPHTKARARPLQSFVNLFFSIGLLFAIGAFTLQLAGTDSRISRELSEGSLLSQSILGFIYTVGILILFRTRIALSLLAATWPVLLLPLFAIISALWSPDPALTLRRAFALLGTVFFGLSLASIYDYRACLQLFIRVLVLTMILSAFWALVFPQSGVHQASDFVEPIHAGKWRGVFAHKNPFGAVAGFTLALLILYGRCAFNSIWIRFGAIGVTLLCLVSAGSGNGYATVFLIVTTGILASFVMQVQPQMRPLIILLCFSVFVVLLFFWKDIESIALQILGKDPDLTGRTLYWNYILSFMYEHWTLGYGYFAGFLSIGATIGAITAVNFGSTHNGYLDILVSFGIVGLLVAAAYFFWLLLNAIHLMLFGPVKLGTLKTFPFCVVLFLIQINVVESSILAPNSVFPLVLAMSATMIARIKIVGNPHNLRHASIDY